MDSRLLITVLAQCGYHLPHWLLGEDRRLKEPRPPHFSPRISSSSLFQLLYLCNTAFPLHSVSLACLFPAGPPHLDTLLALTLNFPSLLPCSAASASSLHFITCQFLGKLPFPFLPPPPPPCVSSSSPWYSLSPLQGLQSWFPDLDFSPLTYPDYCSS